MGHEYANQNIQYKSADELFVKQPIGKSKEQVDGDEDTPTHELEKPIFGDIPEEKRHGQI
jgi:hypothetical protein